MQNFFLSGTQPNKQSRCRLCATLAVRNNESVGMSAVRIEIKADLSHCKITKILQYFMHSKLRTNFTFFRLGQCAGSAAPQCPHGSMCRVRCSLRVSVPGQLLLRVSVPGQLLLRVMCRVSCYSRVSVAGQLLLKGQCAG